MKSFERKTFTPFVFILTILILFSIAVNANLMFTERALTNKKKPSKNRPDTERVVIKQGDILALTFNSTRLPPKDSIEVIKELKKVLNVNHCMPGDFYEILYDSKTGEWENFRYYPPGVSYYLITKTPDNKRIKIEKKKFTTIRKKCEVQGTIHSSLWTAMASRNIPLKTMHSFADIFAQKIDFFTDTKRGDSFKMIYEVARIKEKNTELPLKIIAARYKTSSEDYNAFYYYEKKSKRGDYFNEDGKSLKSAFLKAPLRFKTISSYFTKNRFHPILKYSRPHLGIDYAAPKGTPVSTIGDGIITEACYNKGGFGNLVIVKHANGYETYYGHLSKYGKGVKKGVRVIRGQIIGYVGSTGLATGPHLDFRIKHGGKFINFIKMKSPAQTVLTSKDKEILKKRYSFF